MCGLGLVGVSSTEQAILTRPSSLSSYTMRQPFWGRTRKVIYDQGSLGTF